MDKLELYKSKCVEYGACNTEMTFEIPSKRLKFLAARCKELEAEIEQLETEMTSRPTLLYTCRCGRVAKPDGYCGECFDYESQTGKEVEP